MACLVNRRHLVFLKIIFIWIIFLLFSTVLEAKDSEIHMSLKSLHTNGETALPSTDYKTSENLRGPRVSFGFGWIFFDY